MNKRPNETPDGTMPLAKRARKAQRSQKQSCPSPNPGRSRSRLLCLSRELQDLIYGDVAHDGDLGSFSHTCGEFRASALCRLPGADIIDYCHTPDQQLREQIESKLYICKVNIIAEPWYSSDSSLKFEVEWRVLENGLPTGRTRTSQWTVGDLSSPMARYIYWYRPDDDVQVTFEPATSGYFTGALMILRAKVFDICQVLKHIRPKPKDGQVRHDLSIHFRGGKDPKGRLRKSFWEMRPGHRYSPKRWHHEYKDKWPSVTERRHALKDSTCRDRMPYFYEYLMLPLIFNDQPWIAWRLTFDIEPPNKRTEWSESFGPKALFDATVHLYIEYRRQMGLGSYVPRGREVPHASSANSGQQQHNHDDRPLPLRRDELDERVLCLVMLFLLTREKELPQHFLCVPCQEATQLRLYLLRMRSASPRNAFGGPASPVCVHYIPLALAPVDPICYVLATYRFVWRRYVRWAKSDDRHPNVRGYRQCKGRGHDLHCNWGPGTLREIFEE